MPGVFSKVNPPKRPGAYFNFVAEAEPSLPAYQGVIVAVGLNHDWGPVDTEVSCTSFSEWQQIFGTSTSTSGYKAVRQIFQGEGLTGRGGAGVVLTFRYASSALATADVDLTNGTAADALNLSARYAGTRGNELNVTVQDYAGNATDDELIVYLNTIEVERYQYAKADLAALGTDINRYSDWVVADVNTDGTALTPVANSPLTGGDNGVAPSAADFTALLDLVETSRFSAFVLDDLAGTAWSGGATPTSILASWKAWAVDPSYGLNSKGKRFMSIAGGALAESTSTAGTRSTSLDDPNFINVGGATVVDEVIGELSTSQLAPRIAGIYAQKADNRSMTFGRLAGVELTNGPTNSQIVSAFDRGTLVLSRDSVQDAPVRIERGLTTFTLDTDDNRPVLIYRQPKYVRTMHAIETEFTEWAEENIIGQVTVSKNIREQIIGELSARLRAREESFVLQPGSTVVVDPDPPMTDEDEFIALLYGITFGRSVEQIWNTVIIS